jgi:hypothetical protein
MVPASDAGWYLKRNPKRKTAAKGRSLWMISAVKRCTSLLMVAMLLAGCGSQGTHAGTSLPARASALPSSGPTASAAPALTGAFGVVATSPTAGNYTVSVIGVDGKVVGSAQATSPAQITCAGGLPADVPLPISTSNSRAYYMDAQGVVRFLTVQGETGRATTVPVGGGRRSTFAVSPDDQRIAVIVSDYNSGGAAQKLYVEDVNGGGNHVDIFTSSGPSGLWPIGWHGNDNLVVALVPACLGGGGGPQEFHVVDPATAARRFTIGSFSTCPVAGPPSPGGAVCETTTHTQANVINWTAVTIRSIPLQGAAFAYISPDGNHVALVTGPGTTIEGYKSFAGLHICGWIDDTHVMSAGEVNPRVADVTSGNMVPIAAQGDCAGRLPGGL